MRRFLVSFPALVLLIAAVAFPPATQQTSAGSPADVSNAVVRLPSHGASATVIRTEPGRTYLLGCGHAFMGKDRSKPIVIDMPTTKVPAGEKHVGVTLLKVDYDADLSLVLLHDGPVDFVCRVAPAGHQCHRTLLSVGYDEMRVPPVRMQAHLLLSDRATTFTQEKPWHGRSGGALIDTEAGCLVGVVSGYEVGRGGRGLYVSHAAILRFLSADWQGSVPRDALPYKGGLNAPLPYLHRQPSCPPSS